MICVHTIDCKRQYAQDNDCVESLLAKTGNCYKCKDYAEDFCGNDAGFRASCPRRTLFLFLLCACACVHARVYMHVWCACVRVCQISSGAASCANLTRSLLALMTFWTTLARDTRNGVGAQSSTSWSIARFAILVCRFVIKSIPARSGILWRLCSTVGTRRECHGFGR